MKYRPCLPPLVVLALLVMVGCQQSNESITGEDFTTIYMDSIREGSSYSDLFVISYVVLHGLPEDEAIFYFAKILKYDGGFICWEERYKKIYFFSNDGLYLHHIDAVGAGPMEYGDIGDICYDPDTRLLYVLDMHYSIISYDLNGKGISERTLPQRAPDLAIDAEGKFNFISYLKDSCLIWKSDDDLDMECVDLGDIVIGPYYKKTEFKMAQGIDGPNLLITFPCSEDIYEIRNHRLQKKYHIEYGNRKVFNSEFFSGMSVYERVDYYNAHEDFIQYSGMIFTTDNWLFFYQTNKYFIRQGEAIPGYFPSEYIFYHPEKGTYSINTIIDDRVFQFSWRIRGSFDDTVIHHMYFEDLEKIFKEEIDLKTTSGKRVLDLMDATAEILVLMQMN